jgi:hypothetical protein
MARASGPSTTIAPSRPAWPAAGAVLAAALALIGLTRIDPIAGSNGATFLVLVNAAMVLLALPGALLPDWAMWGRMILFGASGWCLMLLVGGIFTFGSLMLAPLALITLGLLTWPRRAGEPAITGPAIVAHVGGFLALFVALVFTMLVR